MDEEQFEALRRWGAGLRLDDREEVRAAGKAIILLCEEVERLEIALWNERAAQHRSERVAAEEEHEPEAAERQPEAALRKRLKHLRRSTESPPAG